MPCSVWLLHTKGCPWAEARAWWWLGLPHCASRSIPVLSPLLACTFQASSEMRAVTAMRALAPLGGLGQLPPAGVSTGHREPSAHPVEVFTFDLHEPLSKERVEAFSDGVYAIVATLLILDIW